MKRSTLVRGSIFLATVTAAWAILSLGSGATTPELTVGAISTQDYVAGRSETIEDVEATERARQEARDAVERPFYIDTNVEQAVYDSVNEVFSDLRALDPVDTSTIPDFQSPSLSTTTTEAPADDATTTTLGDVEPATVAGWVFLDANGDGVFETDAEQGRSDIGLAGVTVTLTTAEGAVEVSTNTDGAWSAEYPGGEVVVSIDTQDPQVPQGFLIGEVNPEQLVTCEPGETCETETVGFRPSFLPVEDIVASIQIDSGLPESEAVFLAGVVTEDLIRAAFNEPQLLPVVEASSIERVNAEFGRKIEPGQLQEAQRSVRQNPPQVLFNNQIDAAAGGTAAEIVASRLQANYLVNVDEYERDQEEAAEAVPAVMVDIVEGETIVDVGQRLTAWHIAAIEATQVPTLEQQDAWGLAAVLAVLVALLGVYLATFRPEFWARPRMVALLGIIVVLAAGAVRGTVALQETFSWYVLPAVAFGFVTAVLFDQRIAVLMALSVGVLAAVGTLDIGVSVYAILAALAPIPFVSSVSSRGAFRNAVILSSLVAAGVAAATSWFFHIGPNEVFGDVVPISVAFAFGVSVFASLLGLAGLQFFESAFDVTTTLGLLDLTDRNHKALQMLQEKAFGTFNHSLMVGTLADAAARSIGANAVLARAMAYYHDLGKTEDPTFFIENQFGMTNPHDHLDPKESASVIREHVTKGVALAREYKIPTEVTEGIVSHHGDGVMRYFYEKARQMHGDDVDIDDFRHIGHKPRTAESAILMLADSLEAACRAEFQSAEPTPDAIEKVVDRIMNEKLEDGQLSESPLTLGEISKIRRAFLDSLVGHYHQRIAYPNFPGS